MTGRHLLLSTLALAAALAGAQAAPSRGLPREVLTATRTAQVRTLPARAPVPALLRAHNLAMRTDAFRPLGVTDPLVVALAAAREARRTFPGEPAAPSRLLLESATYIC